MKIDTGTYKTIGVPIDCYGTPGGTESGPEALRAAGIARQLNAFDCGDLPVRITSSTRETQSGIVGFSDVCSLTRILRDATSAALKDNSVPVFLGGCCTQVPGIVAGALDHFGAINLVYADGHIDLYDGVTSPSGEAADIPLAVVLGHGPHELLTLLGKKPLLKPERVTLVGYRDYADAKKEGSLLPEHFGPELRHFAAEELRRQGVAAVGDKIAKALLSDALPFVLQLDVDILDQKVFPATDYLMPGGLNWQELEALLAPVARSPLLAAMVISCYNPEKDPGQHCADRLVSFMRTILPAAFSVQSEARI